MPSEKTAKDYGLWPCSACGDWRLRVEPVCRCGRTREEEEAMARDKRLALAGVPPFAGKTYREATNG